MLILTMAEAGRGSGGGAVKGLPELELVEDIGTEAAEEKNGS
jgi:hypothetical protein